MTTALTKLDSFKDLAKEVEGYLKKDILNKVVGLSGGSTIPPLMEALDEKVLQSDKNRWTWIDERLIPYDNPESNFGSVNSYLKKDLCFPLPCVDDDKEKITYQKKLAVNQGLPQLDLLLLGFGIDGHIASLFPNSKELKKSCFSDNWLFRSKASYHPTERWTWGLDALAKTKQTFIIFTGDNNSEKFKRFYEANNEKSCETPLALFIKKNEGNIKSFQIL